MPTRRVSVCLTGWGWGGWYEVVYLKREYYPSYFSLSMKHLHIRPISKVNKNGKIIFYQSLVCFQYRVIHSIMVLKFFANIIGFIVLFGRLQAGRWWSFQKHNFSTQEWNLINGYMRLLSKFVFGILYLHVGDR